MDTPGESAAVKAAWAEAFAEGGEPDTRLVTRRTEAGEPPWYWSTGIEKPAGALVVWLIEYHKDFLAGWYPDLTPARGVTRAEVLDRYVAKIGRSARREATLLRDVVGLVVALDAAELQGLRKYLLPAGWSLRTQEGAAVFEGPEDVWLRVVKAAPGRRGILEAVFSLQRKGMPRTETLGRAVLTVEPERARLRFAP